MNVLGYSDTVLRQHPLQLGEVLNGQRLVDELRARIHDAEKPLTKALPKLAKAASNPELRQAFEDQVEENTSRSGDSLRKY